MYKNTIVSRQCGFLNIDIRLKRQEEVGVATYGWDVPHLAPRVPGPTAAPSKVTTKYRGKLVLY